MKNRSASKKEFVARVEQCRFSSVFSAFCRLRDVTCASARVKIHMCEPHGDSKANDRELEVEET